MAIVAGMAIVELEREETQSLLSTSLRLATGGEFTSLLVYPTPYS